MTLQLHKAIPVSAQDLGLWQGDIKTFVPECDKPSLNWKGGTIPLETLRECLAFFRYGWLEWKSEVQVRLFYNQHTQKWKVEAFPQWCGTGMTTKEIDCDLNTTDQEHKDMRSLILQEVENTGFVSNGTAHSHGATGAFQSATDLADELKQPGLHLTFGKVVSNECEIHGRVSFRGIMYPVDFNQWVPVKEDTEMEPLLTWSVTSLSLTDKEELKNEFPARWLKCCHKKPAPVWTPPAHYNYRYNHKPYKPYDSGVTKTWDKNTQKWNDEWDYDYEANEWNSLAKEEEATPAEVKASIMKYLFEEYTFEVISIGTVAPLIEKYVDEMLVSENFTQYGLESEVDEIISTIDSSLSELASMLGILTCKDLKVDITKIGDGIISLKETSTEDIEQQDLVGFYPAIVSD